jgi:hypothetical protein
MNTPSEIFSIASYVFFPACLIYLICCSRSIEARIAKKVARNRAHFFKHKNKLRGWRVALLYESYKTDFCLTPQLHYCVEVNTGWLLAPRWKNIMVSIAECPKHMISKFNDAELARLPKRLQEETHIHTPGKSQAWQVGFLAITACPLIVELIRLLTLN